MVWFRYQGIGWQNYLKATSNYKNLISEVLVHFLHTYKRNGKPYYKPLINVLKNISKIKKDRKITPLVIVESTLAPKFLIKKLFHFKKKKLMIGKNILLSIAPRRDWFIEGGKNLEKLDKFMDPPTKNLQK